MSYCDKFEYIIQPKDSYKVVRNCPKCGVKSKYINTNNFRVNANGSKLDIWLIYQCEKCRHTYNLSIYERVRPSDISRDLYEKFLANDDELAKIYGTRKSLFIKNKADMDINEMSYEIVPIKKEEQSDSGQITIHNPYEIKVRIDKLLSEILSISRNNIKQLLKDGVICCSENCCNGTTSTQIKGIAGIHMRC